MPVRLELQSVDTAEHYRRQLLKTKRKLGHGLRSQLMRGDRTSSRCWSISLEIAAEIISDIDKCLDTAQGE